MKNDLAAHADNASAARQFVTVLMPYREGTAVPPPEVRLVNCERF